MQLLHGISSVVGPFRAFSGSNSTKHVSHPHRRCAAVSERDSSPTLASSSESDKVRSGHDITCMCVAYDRSRLRNQLQLSRRTGVTVLLFLLPRVGCGRRIMTEDIQRCIQCAYILETTITHSVSLHP